MTLLVYAVASAGGRPAGTGIAGERLRHVCMGSLAAIVGDVATAPIPTTGNLQRYDAVVTRLWRTRAALLPVRFATVVSDRDELEGMLRERQDAFRRQLRQVRGRAQMTVRMVGGSGIGDRGTENPDPQSPIPDPRSPIPDPRSSGRRYLHARVAEARRARELPAFAPLRSAVRRWVREETVEQRGSVATVYHLVPRGSVDRYRRALIGAAEATEVRLLVSGPWPPYAFADGW